MSFESVGEFVAMGGHGLYVWLAYGATLLVIGINVLQLRGARRRLLRELRSLAERRAAAGAAAGGRALAEGTGPLE